MRTLGKIAVALGVVGAIGVTGVLPASADWYGHHHHRYYNYYGGYYGGDPNGCPPGYSLQDGNCAPYQGPTGPYGAPRGSRTNKARAKNQATALFLLLSVWRLPS